MSLPHLLLVDDSQAVLAYQQAALSSLYGLTTASNGVEALAKARAIRPDGILLDLSMPEMNGDEVLAALKADESLAAVPVIVISSEVLRAEACVRAGAAAFMAKPIQAAALRAIVARTLEDAQRKGRREMVAVLSVGVGGVDIGLPLENVLHVLHQLPTTLLPFGPPFLNQTFELGDETVCVLDMAVALGLQHVAPLVDRKLVVLADERLRLALCVDSVRDPEEFSSRDVIASANLGGTQQGNFRRILRAIVRTARGPLSLIDPAALFTADRLGELSAAIAAAADHARVERVEGS